MKKSSVDSTLASIGSKATLFRALMVNAMNTTLGILKAFGTIDVHGLPLNDWVLSVEMLFVQLVAGATNTWNRLNLLFRTVPLVRRQDVRAEQGRPGVTS
jgi:hypothetical protein